MPSAQRLAALGLAVAAATILVLAFLLVQDVQREAELHRASIAAQDVKDSLENLRLELTDVRAAAQLAARTADAEALRTIERRAAEMQGELGFLRERASIDASLPSLHELDQGARLLVTHAQSIAALRRERGEPAAIAAAREAGRLADGATAALERSLAEQTKRINDRTLQRLRVGENVRRYVAWFVGGSIVALLGLFLGYRRLQARERSALKRVEWLAHFDLVTALPNRALLADRLAQETSRARRNDGTFAVLLFDLDGFKAVNDTWGHPAGDRVLAIAAERARGCMRASDTVGRQGGDEFLAILPETGEDGALEVAEKLREALSAPYPLEGATANVSVSIGVSLFPRHGGGVEELQRAADAALYTAKREGKNRTRLATETVARASARARGTVG